jgi:chaperonin GroEL
MRHENALVLVSDTAISAVEQIFPALQIASREGRALVIVAEDVQDQALAALIMNTVRGTMKVAAIRAPGYGEERRACLEDLAMSVGATVLGPASKQSLSKVDISHLGTVKVCEAKKNWSTFVGGSGDPSCLEERVEQLKAEIKQTDSIKECERIQTRINRLASGVAILKIGGTTEIEMMEALHRAEDALQAVRSAQQEGTVAGGGTALVQASERVQDIPFDTLGLESEDQSLGARIVFSAVSAPLRKMAQNAGLSVDLTEKTVREAKAGMGYNFATGKVTDLYQSGVIDPLKVTKTALLNAVSAAGTLITTSHGIVETE